MSDELQFVAQASTS